MFTSIIFSKDRALQLDLALKSIRENFLPNNKIIVIYSTSSDIYEQSYLELSLEHPDVKLLKQTSSIFKDIHCAITACESEYVMFFTDDNIVYRKVEFTEEDVFDLFNVPIQDMFGNDVTYCSLSLRLGKNTINRDYGDGILRPDKTPDVCSIKDPFIIWNRTSLRPGGYWAYPLSVDGHIFEKEAIIPFCDELLVLEQHYSNTDHKWRQTPNEFEAKLQRFYFDLPSAMAAPFLSCVVNSPNNRVQDTIENRNGDHYSYSHVDLNKHFKNGARLSLAKINFNNITCPHQEIDILKGLE
tara:strand:- start:27 stop:923 length:897 start_codon:yes stop_codon:yes gene_type:complete